MAVENLRFGVAIVGDEKKPTSRQTLRRQRQRELNRANVPVVTTDGGRITAAAADPTAIVEAHLRRSKVIR